MSFPIQRPRRLRSSDALRSFVRETRLTPEGFIYPLFVCPGEGVRKEVRSMPGVCAVLPSSDPPGMTRTPCLACPTCRLTRR